MPVNFASYEIPKTGLHVSERALYVTGHNISNVNTPGYVRQQAISTTKMYKTEYFEGRMQQFGLGSDIQEIRQIRHTFLDNMYRNEVTSLGYWEVRNKTYEDIQAILGEPSEQGLQVVLNQFWESWQELSKSPDNLTTRAFVRQRAEELAYQLNHIGRQLDRFQEDLNTEIKVRVDEVNEITKKIAKLNLDILATEITGDRANDYRDQRNLLLDKLSKLCDVEIYEQSDGLVDVVLGGYYLVTKGKQQDLVASWSPETGMFYKTSLKSQNVFDVQVNNGIIKGLMESRGEVYGAQGSISNGMPNSRADIVIAIDNSNGSVNNLDKVKSSILKYTQELVNRGIDFNLRLVTFSDSATVNSTVWTKDNLNDPANSFYDAVNAITEINTVDDNNFNALLTEVEGLSFRNEVNKFLHVFTHEGINGDETASIPQTDVDNMAKSLENKGIKLSVVSEESGGSPTKNSWDYLTGKTSGSFYDTSSLADFEDLMVSIIGDTDADVNENISLIYDSKNIISDIRRRLNAMVNVLAREVNYIHRQGKTLIGSDGGDVFVPIDPNYPMQMGNIMLNPELKDLNNICASATGNRGDNTIALKIANYRHNEVATDITGLLSLDDYYQSIVLKVGTGGSDARNIMSNQTKLCSSADNLRKTISDVSMDEEMSNMMKYKFSYDAAARALNMVDSLFENIINRMGKVGR